MVPGENDAGAAGRRRRDVVALLMMLGGAGAVITAAFWLDLRLGLAVTGLLVIVAGFALGLE